jgi:hypothetical protein
MPEPPRAGLEDVFSLGSGMLATGAERGDSMLSSVT